MMTRAALGSMFYQSALLNASRIYACMHRGCQYSGSTHTSKTQKPSKALVSHPFAGALKSPCTPPSTRAIARCSSSTCTNILKSLIVRRCSVFLHCPGLCRDSLSVSHIVYQPRHLAIICHNTAKRPNKLLQHRTKRGIRQIVWG